MGTNRAEHIPQRTLLMIINRAEHITRRVEQTWRRSEHFTSPPPSMPPLVPFGLWPDAAACDLAATSNLANTSDLANTPDLATTSNHMPTYPKAF